MMNFKRIALLTGILLTCASAASAQHRPRVVTPFTARVVDSLGNKHYIEPLRDQRRNSLFLFYGTAPLISQNGFANRFLSRPYDSPGVRITYTYGDITSSFGSLGIGYSVELIPWLELAIPFIYSSSQGTLYSQDMTRTFDTFTDTWFSLVPNLKINWMATKYFSLYSRAGAGFSLVSRKVDHGNWVQSNMAPAWQLSPIGIEAGSKVVAFFAEAGYGFYGTVSFGLKVKLPNLKSSNKYRATSWSEEGREWIYW